MTKRRLLLFLSAAILSMVLVGVVYVAVVSTVGRDYCTFAFVPHAVALKLERLSRIHSPRFIILSGSNAQSCLDSEMITRQLNVEVANMGVIVAIPLRFYPSFLEQNNLGSGDVVLLPLELPHYTRSAVDMCDPFGVSFLWGVCPKALETLSVRELTDLYLKKGLGWLQCVLPKRFPTPEYLSPQPVAHYENLAGNGHHGEMLYETEKGDHVAKYGATFQLPDVPQYYPPVFSDEFLASFNKIKRLVESHGAKLMIGYTAQFNYPNGLLLAEFQAELEKLRVPIIGDPKALCLPYGYFTDSIMHCNVSGRQLYSHEMVKDLCRVLGKPIPETPSDWPLLVFNNKPGETQVTVRQPETCRGVPTFGEFLIDRGSTSTVCVVERVLANGEPVAFEEHPKVSKNLLWVKWESAVTNVVFDVVTKPSYDRACLERVLMEPDHDERVNAVTSFNEVSEDFEVDSLNPRRFVCRRVNGDVARLKVRIPNWRSHRYRLSVKVRLPDDIKEIVWGGTGYVKTLPVEKGEFSNAICPNPSEAYTDESGDAVFGMSFKAGTLKPGDVVEVIEWDFRKI